VNDLTVSRPEAMVMSFAIIHDRIVPIHIPSSRFVSSTALEGA